MATHVTEIEVSPREWKGLDGPKKRFILGASALVVVLYAFATSIAVASLVAYRTMDARNHLARMSPDMVEAGQTPPDPLPSQGNFVNVRVGVYVDNITDLSIRNSNWSGDFYVWFLWHGQKEELQRAMNRAMRGRSGSAVVVDVASGRVLAAVNLSGAARRVVRPGSTGKPFVLLALLSSGAVEPSAPIACRRTLQIGGRKLDCGHPAIAAPLDAINALAYSCNQYFTGMAARLRPAQMQRALLKAGLANASGLAEREATGTVELCQNVEQLQLQSIGVDHVTTTPLAMLNAYRQLALRRRAGDSDAALETVFRGLDAAAEYGMARLAQPPGPVKVSGKTGTAKAQEGHWRHGWFAGFAPAERPEIALVVFVERGTGPADAAPIASRIFSAYFGRGEPGRQAGLPTNAGLFGSKR